MKNFKQYLKNEDGLVTIEWVGIAAVVVLAAVVISAAIMNQTQSLAGSVTGNQAAIATQVDAATTGTIDLDFVPTSGGTTGGTTQ